MRSAPECCISFGGGYWNEQKKLPKRQRFNGTAREQPTLWTSVLKKKKKLFFLSNSACRAPRENGNNKREQLGFHDYIMSSIENRHFGFNIFPCIQHSNVSLNVRYELQHYAKRSERAPLRCRWADGVFTGTDSDLRE